MLKMQNTENKLKGNKLSQIEWKEEETEGDDFILQETGDGIT